MEHEHISKITNKEKELISFIQNCPLLEQAPTIAALLKADEFGDGTSLFYGTDLSTPKEVSKGLPFDVLGMMLVAHNIRDIAGMQSIIHHIADTHAKSNSFTNNDEIDMLAKKVRSTLELVCKKLKLPHFEFILASEIDHTDDYKRFYEYFASKSDMHPYVISEMSDIAWYKKHKNVHTKLGWVATSNPGESGFDERLFDNEYMRITNEFPFFVYTKPGRTFDKSRPKASPYIIIENETRIPLEGGCDVKSLIDEAVLKTGDKDLMGAIKHLTGICRMYEKHMELRFEQMPLHEKVQTILNQIFN